MTGTISRDECLVLNEVLGYKTPSGCYSLSHNNGTDAFSYPNDKPFVGEDAKRHRNTWLMPNLARRLTKNSPHHVSNWRKPVSVDKDECQKIRQLLEDKLGKKDANKKLPKACQI
eukprot:CAMPEP_0202441770 /NCGR_PEP_ID=MMETSP1360-20130828/1273_1 /ASSEMBLY_ACC=CAM_ASM_000848 /TAXON_ID=515479 /ORGANISM="Licmophora paradoxa, Strain CCMP2313" /LENGTH=114 /DNA_ID=CAMNT_0049056899 /DNA_START=124 /DNA_END=468 /DNA_ORIENTATION=+